MTPEEQIADYLRVSLAVAEKKVEDIRYHCKRWHQQSDMPYTEGKASLTEFRTAIEMAMHRALDDGRGRSRLMLGGKAEDFLWHWQRTEYWARQHDLLSILVGLSRKCARCGDRTIINHNNEHCDECQQ